MGIAAQAKPEQAGTLAGLLREAQTMLADAGVQNAESEAVWLAERALGMGGLRLKLEGRSEVQPDDRQRMLDLLARRAAREPLQYILGTQEFCGLEIEVGPEVLIPRPETETLVEQCLSSVRSVAHPLIADIGTGSGCVAVALARALPASSLYATDLSPAALKIARRNAARYGVTERIQFLAGDLFEPLRRFGLQGRLTAVVSNPPYIPEGDLAGLQPEVARYEPRLALAGGADGLEIYRRLLKAATEFLSPAGRLLLEVGQGQAEPVARLALEQGGYGPARKVCDAAGIERIVCLQKR